jgi:hypothetical protein
VTASQSPGFGLSRLSISGWRENVAEANADGVLLEAQHDVIGVDNVMWRSDFATGAILSVDGRWRRALSGKERRSAPLIQRGSNAT